MPEQDNPDVFKILKDLELKATGLDEKTLTQQAGYFVAFRDIGLPIRKEDFDDPWNPNRRAEVPAMPPGTDPAAIEGEKTGSGALSDEDVYNDQILTEINRSQRAYVNTFLLTDTKLEMSPRYTVMNGATKVSDTWWTILQGANGIPGELELSPEIQAAYDEAKAVLMDEDDLPTRQYEKYLEYSDEYDEAQQEYAQEFADAFGDPQRLATWPQQGVFFRKKVDKAWTRWNSLGHKQRIEAALNTLAAQGQDPAVALISRAKQKLEQNLFDFPGVGLLPLTLMIPSGWADESDQQGWNTYSTSSSQRETHYTSSSTSYGGGGGFNLGFWSAGASLDSKSSKQDFSMEAKDLTISFSYMVVDVFRPWIGSELLNLDNWFLFGDYPAGTISEGTMGQHVPDPDKGFEPGFLPSLVTSLIVVKDLCIKWSDTEAEWQRKTSSISANASFGYGPFVVKGHYGKKEHSFDLSTNSQKEGLTAPGIQLVGYVSQIMPRSPRQDGKAHMQETQPVPVET
jgi:hypothetical protein